MVETKGNKYDNMQEFIESIFNVLKIIHKQAEGNKDERFKMISMVVFSYVNKLAKEYNINLKQIKDPKSINLIPVFEYISCNNIELLDFEKVSVNDTVTPDYIERFALTHIYHITQQQRGKL